VGGGRVAIFQEKKKKERRRRGRGVPSGLARGGGREAHGPRGEEIADAIVENVYSTRVVSGKMPREDAKGIASSRKKGGERRFFLCPRGKIESRRWGRPKINGRDREKKKREKKKNNGSYD